MNRSEPRLDEASRSLIREKLWNMASVLLLTSYQRGARTCGALIPCASDPYYQSMFGAESYEVEAGEPSCVQLKHGLSAVGRALDLLAGDRYGRCDACAAELEEELLFGQPHILCCRSCQGALEARFAPELPEQEPPRVGGLEWPCVETSDEPARDRRSYLPSRQRLRRI